MELLILLTFLLPSLMVFMGSHSLHSFRRAEITDAYGRELVNLNWVYRQLLITGVLSAAPVWLLVMRVLRLSPLFWLQVFTASLVLSMLSLLIASARLHGYRRVRLITPEGRELLLSQVCNTINLALALFLLETVVVAAPLWILFDILSSGRIG